jgi:hypothetical protein
VFKNFLIQKKKMMALAIIISIALIGWWFSKKEFFMQDSDVARQTGRIEFAKKQLAEVQAKITVEKLDAMLTQADDLDEKTQTLMENMKPANNE